MPESRSRQHATWCNRRQHGLNFIFCAWCPSKYYLDLWCLTEAAAINDSTAAAFVCRPSATWRRASHTHTHTHIGPHQPFGSCDSACKLKWCGILYLFITYFFTPPLDSDMMKCEIRWPSGVCGQGGRGSVSMTPMHSNIPPYLRPTLQ